MEFVVHRIKDIANSLSYFEVRNNIDTSQRNRFFSLFIVWYKYKRKGVIIW